MAIEVRVGGISKSEFEQAKRRLDDSLAQISISATLTWDEKDGKIVVDVDTNDEDEAITDEILRSIESIVSVDNMSVSSVAENWNANAEWWDCAPLVLDGIEIPTCIDSPAAASPCATGMKTYETLKSSIPRLVADWRCAAADELHPTYNDRWSQVALDKEAFKSKLRLESIMIDRNGWLSAYFSAADLFNGHSVVIDLDAALATQNIRLG